MSPRLAPVPRLLVFDMDGTLTDTLPLMVDVMVAAVGARGHEVPAREAIREALGISLRQTILDLLPGIDDAEAAEIEALYRAGYAPEEARQGLRLFEGVRETLEHLRAQGHALAIATGKSKAGLLRVLEKLDLGAFFPVWRTSDLTFPKPHPRMLLEVLAEAGAAPGEAVMIGDAQWDVEMANAAGVRSVAATYGSHPRERLLRAGATTFLDRFTDLPLLIRCQAPN